MDNPWSISGQRGQVYVDTGASLGQPGSTLGQPGVKLRSTRGKPEVNPWATLGQPGITLRSTGGQLVKLRSTCTTLPVPSPSGSPVCNMKPLMTRWKMRLS